jgi:GPH family glycoside/pentoside/hexuronide:cation symporter
MLCNLVIGVTASFTHSIFVELFSFKRSKEAINYRLGYMLSAFIWASVFFFPPLVVFFGIREKPFVSNKDEEENAKGGVLAFAKKMAKLWISVFSTLKNRAFLILTIFYFLSWTSVQLVQNNLFLYDKYVIRKEASFTWIMLLLQLVAAASLFGWSFVSRLIGKRFTFIIGLSLWCAVSIGNYWMTDKTPVWAVYVSVTICAIGVSVTFLIPWSMIPDIIDQDEVQFGSRREGVFYSLFVLFQKIGLAVALSSSSYSIGAAGYISPAEANPEGDPLYQPAGVIKTLKLINGPIPAIMLALAMVACFFYPLGRKAVAENAEILKKRRADADAISKPAFVAKKDDSSDISFDIDDAGVGSGTEHLRNA